MKAKVGSGSNAGIIIAVFLAFPLGFCFGARPSQPHMQQTSSSSLSQHHNHNEGFEGHTRKVRRLQRLLLHNNRHTMQFRTEDEQTGTELDHSRNLREVTNHGFTKPDECPPRQTESVQDEKNGKKRPCPRKCSTDSDCLNDRKLCLCDGACGMSCIRPEKECPELPDPPHGQVHLTGRHFNDRAVYTCDDGYQIVGLEQVICNSNGHWSGAQPSCKQGTSSAQSRYYCGAPTIIPHAKHNGSSEQMYYDLDTELSYQCDPGYKRKGFQVAQCFFYNGTARWFGPDLKCHPIDCGAPEEILNGKRAGDCTTYRCQIKYECVPGFSLVGKDTRYCQKDGTWTPSELPTCVPVQCGLPESPVNGKAHYTALAYKSVVTYTCKYGFMVVGDATRTCGEDKEWSGLEPKCKEINCGSPGFLPNGWLEGSRMNLGDVVNFKCVEGMKFEGESLSTTCQVDGAWSHPLPKCLAPCMVPDVPMGRVVNLTSYRNTVMHGENITVECNHNYELEGNVTQITCNNGTFDRMPKCEPARCKTLPAPPKNGMVVVPNTKHGGKGLYQCKDGFMLKGDNTTKCDFGNWTRQTPSCELIYCPFPGYIEGGKVLLVGNMGLYDYRHYVKKVKNNRQIMFECGRGSKVVDGPPGATCIDGRWSPSTLPRCEVEYHPKMEWLSKRSAPNGAIGPIRIPKRAKRSLSRRLRAKRSPTVNYDLGNQ